MTVLRPIGLCGAHLVLALSMAAHAAAQEGPQSVEAVVRPGMTVWITDHGGRGQQSRTTAVAAGILTALTDMGSRRLAVSDIARIQARESDSLVNGAVVGAAVAVGGGLFLCTRTEPWANCRDDVGPILRMAAVGAGIGMAVDALIRSRRTIDEARPTTRWRAAPIIDRRSVGAQVLISMAGRAVQ